jgi:hypothetical protein
MTDRVSLTNALADADIDRRKAEREQIERPELAALARRPGMP